VLLDPSVSTEDEDSLKLLAEFSDRKPPVPVLVFSERTNLSDRLQIARSGGTTFFQKPIPPAQALEAVTLYLAPGNYNVNSLTKCQFFQTFSTKLSLLNCGTEKF
jgi:DNA-binding NarL/FixJ family response regulator